MMRIFFIAQRSGPDLMEKHIIETLISLGHDVKHFNVKDCVKINAKIDKFANFIISKSLREPERLLENKLMHVLSDYQPDFVLVLLGNMISPKTIKKLRSIYAGKIVCWCQDQITTLGRQYIIGCQYDMIFFKDRYLVDTFKKYAGLNTYYLPEACNPIYHKSISLSVEDREKYSSEICTFGNIYYYRQTILESLLNYNLHVWGNRPDWLIDRLGDKYKKKCVYEVDKCKVIAGAKIVLNTLHFGEINGLSCRVFEVAGCGGFQLVSDSPAIQEHFRIGEEIEVFNSRTDLLEKVEYYLNNQDKAREIAKAGQERAYAEHTYKHRLEELIGQVV